MHSRLTTTAAPAHHPSHDRRMEPREPTIGCLWMIGNHSSNILRCRCVDISRKGMRLRVPLGYGIQEGQRYELTSHLPGQSAPPGLGLMFNRRAQVIRTPVSYTHLRAHET